MQAVSPSGVGAIIDLPGEALMVAGLNAWPVDDEDAREDIVAEERLARFLGVTQFRMPPVRISEGGYELAKLPMVRFPHWHFCPRCRALKAARWDSNRVPRCDSETLPRYMKDKEPCANASKRKRWRMAPLRFVAVCEHGHIEDFPWVAWAHSTPGQPLDRDSGCDEPSIHLVSTGQSGLAALRVECQSCGASRSMQGSTREDALDNLVCSGYRPWLGGNHEDCSSKLRVVQRGASNVYFPNVASSILIPPYAQKFRQLIDRPHFWAVIEQAVGPDGLPIRAVSDMLATSHGLDPGALWDVVMEKWKQGHQPVSEDVPLDDEGFRYQEYRALIGPGTEEDLFMLRPCDLDAYEPWLSDIFEHVALVEKLTETRALTGIARLEPGGEGTGDGHHLSLGDLDWRPAIQVHGEGIMLVLAREAVERWETGYADRARVLEQRFNQWRVEMGQPTVSVPARLILLHTLSHLLVRELSQACGYGTSSIRERIYCQRDGEDWMCGVLLYTAAGDADGSMGGLVAQGREHRLETLVRNALLSARWCSSDPVCRESEGQGSNALNFAACHACGLLPETSCEFGNRLLDRHTIDWLLEHVATP
jgi:hypothetical protein